MATRNLRIDVTFLRTGDIPVLCAEGAIDLGITGGDLLTESGVELTERLPLGVGRCRLAICVPEDAEIEQPRDLSGKRVATGFPNVTTGYLTEHGATARL